MKRFIQINNEYSTIDSCVLLKWEKKETNELNVSPKSKARHRIDNNHMA